jgi:hypothetical protein
VLRPRFNLFNKPYTLAISQQGIALRTAEGNQLLAPQWDGMEQLTELLAKHSAVLNQQTVNVVLSNTFVRYLVLPWQDNVVKESDWQAIAKHAFRQQFDAAANDWRVAVSFGGYGQTILAAAIDESLCTQLAVIAQQFDFKLGQILPLLTVLDKPTDKDWAMLAEPQRITLCQLRDEQWQQILIDAPQAGKEYDAADKLIERSLLSVSPSEQPRKIATYVSPNLKAHWQESIANRQQLIARASGQQHAQWMANIAATTAKQPLSQLNFGVRAAKPDILSTSLLLLACGLAAVLWWGYQHQQTQVSHLQQNGQSVAQPSRIFDTTLIEETNLVRQTQQRLNLPWMPMLSALEKVKQNNPAIQLVRINPNPSLSEIKLSGEAATFADITQLLTDLRAALTFSDAVLVNQHLEQDADKPALPPIVVFEINVGWRI